ncbi:hypothetical protein SAMN04489798_4387 [Pseudomonas arsenicoxydans]|uniref:HNH endonuclease n=1 Tax=Pseudomonas arsenicoxydans TaxID=702115 RepID=A0A1H0P2K7_9PSED|nr:HNH endonuclease [Pseudomonas arsenicoxydans]SDO98890.1 hypothetical protein SAMN04489798_4387 [Pseudomonas arsenicoxydans]
MAFSPKVATLIAYRSGYICNNPECNVLTIGPATSDPQLSTKKGEAAHIVGEKPGAARYEDIGTAQVGSAENGLWLCVACHTLIDKNNGVDHKTSELRGWKSSHEELMSVLLRTHRSPLPLVRRFSANTKVAQNMVDTLSHRGVMFQPYVMEDPTAAIASIKQIRLRLLRCLRQIDLDNRLRDICNDLISAFRDLMNETSRDDRYLNSYIDILRRRCGLSLYRLEHEYGCIITGDITAIVQR